MTEFSIAVEIAAPPERVWAVLADLERWPEWTASVTSVEPLEPGPLAVGTRARVSQPKLKPAVWEVTEVKAARSFTWVTRHPGLLVTGLHQLEPIEKGTLATLAVRFSGYSARSSAGSLEPSTTAIWRFEADGLRKRSTL
jgi:uncharacterized protein YndB with AHSA1/START domain